MGGGHGGMDEVRYMRMGGGGARGGGGIFAQRATSLQRPWGRALMVRLRGMEGAAMYAPTTALRLRGKFPRLGWWEVQERGGRL